MYSQTHVYVHGGSHHVLARDDYPVYFISTMIVLLILLFIAPATAGTWQARIRFRHWFPVYRDYFEALLANCSDELAAYDANLSVPGCASGCSCMIDCLISKTQESVKTNMQSASIVLGLMPTLIPYLAPSIAEVAVLSTRSPLLALLVCFGTPAVRDSTAADIHEVVGGSSLLVLAQIQGWLKPHTHRRFVSRVLLYVGTLAAIANIVEMSVRIEYRTASGWRCNQLFMPLVWSELSIAAFGIGMLAIRMRWPTSPPSSKSTIEKGPLLHTESQATKPMLAENAPSQASTSHRRSSSSAKPLWQNLKLQEDGFGTELLWTLARIAAGIQVFFGVLVLASLVFVGFVDAIFISLRYAASCVVCRFVVAIELADLRARLKLHEETS